MALTVGFYLWPAHAHLVAVSAVVVVTVGRSADRDEVDIHDRQSRHYERTQRTDVHRRVDRLEDTNYQLFEFDVADHDLSIAGAADHARIALLK